MSKRMTKGEFQKSLGAFNPVGHTMIAFASVAIAGDAAASLREQGFAPEDIISYSSAELLPKIEVAVRNASEAAGFGYEINLMKRYMTLATENCGWLLVHSPEQAQTDKVTLIAQRFGAKTAVSYGRLVNEDLV